jgi:hypothetical protein
MYFIYIIYDDRTIIGFVGFVVNLLNRPTDGAKVQRPKKSYFSSAFENVKLSFKVIFSEKIFRSLNQFRKIASIFLALSCIALVTHKLFSSLSHQDLI